MAASQTGFTLAKVTTLSDVSLGNIRQQVFDVTPTASSYFTTGYLITAANVGLRLIFGVTFLGQSPPSGTPLTTIVLPVYDITNTALQFYQSTTGAPNKLVEVASATDLSGFIFRMQFWGN